MAWTAPMTAVAGAVFLASEFNTFVRDNLNETAPAKATTAGRLIVTTGANAVDERAVSNATISATQSTTSTSFVDLATTGPGVTVTTGTLAVAMWSSEVDNNATTDANLMSIAISGATTLAASSDWALIIRSVDAPNYTQQAAMIRSFTLTAGANTFTAKYASGGSTARFANRRLTVFAL